MCTSKFSRHYLLAGNTYKGKMDMGEVEHEGKAGKAPSQAPIPC